MSDKRAIKNAKRLKKKAALATKKSNLKPLNAVGAVFKSRNSIITKEYIVNEMHLGFFGKIKKEAALLFFDCMEKQHSLDFDLMNPKPVTMSISKTRIGSFKSEPSSWFTTFGEKMAIKYGKEEGGSMTGDINLSYISLMDQSNEQLKLQGLSG